MKRIRINLTYPTTDVPVNNQHQMNGFIFSSFGENCKYHDRFSDYSISSLQGGTLKDDKKTLEFKNDNPHFYVSGNNEFIEFAIKRFMFSDASFFGMKVKNLDSNFDFNVNEKFDNIITISPVLVKVKGGKKLTIEDDEWLECLIDNCKKKLEYLGIIDDTFRIEVVNKEKAKKKSIMVGDVFNPSTMVRLKVFGKKDTRRTLYCLGLGGSTGSGFGSIKIYN